MATARNHRGWNLKHGPGILAAVYNGTMPGTVAHSANTALDGVLIGTPVCTAIPVDSMVIANNIASGDLVVAMNDGSGNSWEYMRFDASAGLIVFNEASSNLDFRVETNSMAFAIYADGGLDSIVIGSNTDTSSADQLVNVTRAARTATASTNYYDLRIAPAGAVTVPTGTTALVATVSLVEPNVTATGTVTRAATLHIASQPTEGGTANAAIYFGAAANIACTTSLTFNDDSEDIDFRVETNGMAYALLLDGGSDSLVLGSNTDTHSADQLVTISRSARTADAATNYYDLRLVPTGAVTIPTGTTAIVATVGIEEPNITATGTVTDACSLYIVAAPTEGAANYALLIAAGTAALKGGAYFGATVTTAALVSQATSGAGTTTHYIGNQTITTSSDSRVKTDIREWQGEAMALLRRAEPLKEFRYNLPGGGPQDSGYGPNARGTYLGFMAQDTLKWAPWVVNAGAGADCQRCLAGQPCDEHSPWGVEYQHLVPLAIAGVQEIDRRLAKLEALFPVG